MIGAGERCFKTVALLDMRVFFLKEEEDDDMAN